MPKDAVPTRPFQEAHVEGNKIPNAVDPPGGRASVEEEVSEFLGTPGIVGPGAPQIHETHIARVFVGEDRALKVKRHVNLAFVDFTTLQQRQAACESEIAVNRDNAPDIYKRVVAITRQADGTLAIGGSGTPIEWAVEMQAFGEGNLLSDRAMHGPLPTALVKQTADVVFAMHGRAARVLTTNAVAKMRSIVIEVADVCRTQREILDATAIEQWSDAARANIEQQEPLLLCRARAGAVRRCHGDLHLANIVVWKDRPVLFDALEFSKEMATIDTLYDLAFLLMDLMHHHQRPAANLIMNRYIWRTGYNNTKGVQSGSESGAADAHTGDVDDIKGLALLPLFLSCRAGIRAMVEATRAATSDLSPSQRSTHIERANSYLVSAIKYLTPPPPRLVAIGGLSGTGKSTLAAALAPQLGEAIGALHLRSDLERKAIMGVVETQRLPPQTYTREASQRVYERLVQRAAAGIAAGQSVIVDAVFAEADERARLAEIATDYQAPFAGLWLEADPETLRHRVDRRTGDASDATSFVVDRQLGYQIGSLDPAWTKIDAGGGSNETLARGASVLGIKTHND